LGSSVKFIGDFVFQADLKVPRGRTARRVDVIGRHEFTLHRLDRDEVDQDAVVIRTDTNKQPLHMSGWDGRLWMPMESPRLRPSDKPAPLDVRRLAEGCVYDPNASHSFLREDPMMLGNRFSVGRLAPHRKFDPERGHTIREVDFTGKLLWSNKVEAVRRYEAAAQNLIVIGETVFCHVHPPCWATVTGDDAHTFLSVPSYIVNDDKDVFPMCGSSGMVHLETFGLLNFDRAAGGASGRPVKGEVVSFDPAYAARDEFAWALYPRLWFLRAHGQKFFDWLSADGVQSLKVLTDLWRNTDFHDLSPITRGRHEILSHVSLLADELRHCPLPPTRMSWRDWVLPPLERVLEANRRMELADGAELSLADAEVLATMIPA
jgi:hypothetical protein